MRTVDVSASARSPACGRSSVISLDRWMADDLAPKLDVNPTPCLMCPIPQFARIPSTTFISLGKACRLRTALRRLQCPAFLRIASFSSKTTWWRKPGPPGLLDSHRVGQERWVGHMPNGCRPDDGRSGVYRAFEIQPPMEIRDGLRCADDSIPWSFFHSLALNDEKDKAHSWSPGMQNIPGKGESSSTKLRSAHSKPKPAPRSTSFFDKQIRNQCSP